MDLYVYLPIAGSSIHILLLIGLGGVVGLLSGLFGVGGGFLMTPLLIMIGIPPTVSAASDSNQIVAASASGTLAHYRLGNVDFKMGILLLIGGVSGGTLGVQIIKILRSIGNADFVIKVTYVVILSLIGGYMFLESLRKLKGPSEEKKDSLAPSPRPSIYARSMKSLPFKTDFPKSGIQVSVLLPIILGFFVGILAAIMGVGGGFLMVPCMVYLLRMPMHVVIGTSLFQIFFTCVNVTIMQSYLNHTVDFMLALLLLIGSASGVQIGARLSKRLKGDQLKILLASIVLAVMIKMLLGLILPPHLLLSYKGIH